MPLSSLTFRGHEAQVSLSIRPSYGARGEEILDPFSLPFFPFSPETPDTQARLRSDSCIHVLSIIIIPCGLFVTDFDLRCSKVLIFFDHF